MADGARYSRQTVLPEIGQAGQEKLAAARVLVVGAGGLGCPVLLYLAGAGVGTIGIVDFDRVDAGNLQRQILFASSDEGKSKAATAQARLLALNPDIAVNAFDEELTDKNAMDLLSGYDIVVDGTDNFSAKFLINDAAVKLGKPVIYGALQGFEGQAAVFNHGSGPCYRCLHPQPPQARVMNCAEAGVVGALAGITGTVQAMEAVKLIVGHESFQTLSGRLWMIDARTMETGSVNVPKRRDCRTCSQPAGDVVLHYAAPACAGAVAEICCSDKIPADALFIDVRGSDEWNAGHIANARHLPLPVLQNNPAMFTPPGNDRCCVIYCQGGERSKKAAKILLQAGHTGIYSLKGGYDAWRRFGN